LLKIGVLVAICLIPLFIVPVFAEPFTLFHTTFVDSFSVAGQETSPTGVAFSSDGTKMFVVGISGDDVNEYTLSSAFDVSTSTFVDSFSVAAQDLGPQGVTFNSDGTKMFVLGVGGPAIHEYTLTAPFDVSTSTFVDSFSVSAEGTSPRSLAFSTDGTKMFVVDSGAGDNINEYTLSTGFDISSTVTFVDSFSVAGQDASPAGIAFSSDGTKMFVAGDTGDDINQYTLTAPFDVSTSTFVDSFSVAGHGTGPRGVAFNSDGTKMFVVDTIGDAIIEYTLTTPFTLFHTTFVDSFSVAGQETSPHDVVFSSDGTKMFVVGSIGDAVYEYTLSSAFDVSTSTFVDSFSVAGQDNAPLGLAFSTDGTKMFVVGTVGDAVYEYTLSSAFDVSTSLFVDSFSVAAQDTSPGGVAFSSDGTKMFVVGDNGDAVYEYTLSTGFDISSTVTFVDSFSVAGQDSSPTGVAFSSDGTKMFVVSFSGDDVNEYILSSAFDVSTASFVDSFSVAAQETNSNGLTFSSDGMKMFVVGQSGDDVNEYTLTTPFTLFHTTFVDSFSIAAQENSPGGVAFSSDGTKMFVIGQVGQDVNEYTLSSAFDVSTASFVDSFSIAAQEINPLGLAFSSDGTKMFVAGNVGDDVNEYTLSSAFDVSTASFVDSFSVAAQDLSPGGVAFSSDGTKMFVVGTIGDAVYEYTLSSAFDVSTASFVDSFSVAAQDLSPQGVAFSTDGTKMFVAGAVGEDVNEYTLSSPFDVSTAVFVESFSVAAQETELKGLAFSSDGTKMFVIGEAGDAVYEYNIVTIGPSLSSAIWDDTDNVDAVISAGDTLTLTFDIATNAPSVSNQAEIDPIINVAGLFGTTATYSGAWSAGDTVLTITIGSIGTASSVIGGNVGPGVTSVRNAIGTSLVWANTIPSTGDFGALQCTIETAADVDTIISSSCTVLSSITAGGSITVQNGAVMTIPSGVTLDINFATKNLTVQAGGGVLIEAGGTIT